MGIVATDDTLGGKPRLEGRRISVLQIAEQVVDHGADPATVADQLEISLAEVHEALAYYYEHIDQIDSDQRQKDDLKSELSSSSKAPDAIERSE